MNIESAVIMFTTLGSRHYCPHEDMLKPAGVGARYKHKEETTQ